MNQYDKYRVVNIPERLLLMQDKLNIDEHQMLALIKILSFNQAELDFVELSKKWGIKRELIMQLNNNGLITVTEKVGQIIIDINPLFSKLEQSSGMKNESTVVNQVSDLETLTSDKLDRISFLLNRRINNMELERLKSWLTMGYTIAQIEVAIQKSTINQVDNFNYIEKVLLNSNERKDNKVSKIQRNIDLY